MNNRSNILIADDDLVVSKILEMALQKQGYRVFKAINGVEALSFLQRESFSCVVTDLDMPQMDGLTLIKAARDLKIKTPFIVASSQADFDSAVTAFKLGACEFLPKPIDLKSLEKVCKSACMYGDTLKEKERFENALMDPPIELSFLGSSDVAETLRQQIKTVANFSSPVLLTGENGTGKGLVARIIHQQSKRAASPFVVTSCPNLPAGLLESEMFGHERGAFTGALQRRIGRLEVADGGTIFLDEIGDLPLELQPKLLSVIQDKIFQRVGGDEVLSTNARLIAATNANLKEKIKQGGFRQDLYFRLNVFEIHVPALRERAEDIPELVDHQMKKIAFRHKSVPKKINQEAMEKLCCYSWPGNVRQLENVIERTLVMSTNSEIATSDLPEEIRLQKPIAASGSAKSDFGLAIANIPLETLERIAIQQTLRSQRGNKMAAARALGVTTKSIYNKLARYKLDVQTEGAAGLKQSVSLSQ